MKKSIKSAWLSFAAYLFDLSAVAVAWLGAYWTRFNGDVPSDLRHSALMTLLLVVPVYGVLFRIVGLYRGLWVFASLPDLIRIVKAVGTGAILLIAVTLMFRSALPIPRSVLLMTPVLLLVLMGGARAAYRSFKEFRRYGGLVAQGKPVIILGAGRAGADLVRELSRSSEWRLVGLLDDDIAKRGRELYGVKILGPIRELPEWAEHFKAGHAIIAMPSATADAHRRTASLCVRAGIKAMVLPSLAAIDAGKPFLSRIRQIDVEDLLGRSAITIDAPHVNALLHGRIVMVTGAGGSIGSELCRQIARFGPAQLVAYEMSEFALYRLVEEFRDDFPDVALIPVAGDVKDGVLLDHVLSRHTPFIVFHAAAYKHVPLMEERNTWQAVRNNTLGTYCVARAAIEHGIARFVLISTDKAVNPTNVMGASKRLAEMVCQSLEQSMQRSIARTHFAIVRFGNVLGSDGSVIPKFEEQIAKGGPVTVTDPEITRYFMTIPEASLLVLQASSMGQYGEIFLLDMGEPVKIVDLARDLIRLHGFTESQIKIVYTGLRPGEKLYEELLADSETTRATEHVKLRVARARAVPNDFLDKLQPWLMQRRIPDDEEVRRELRRLIPEYVSTSQPMLASVRRPDGVVTIGMAA